MSIMLIVLAAVAVQADDPSLGVDAPGTVTTRHIMAAKIVGDYVTIYRPKKSHASNRTHPRSSKTQTGNGTFPASNGRSED